MTASKIGDLDLRSHTSTPDTAGSVVAAFGGLKLEVPEWVKDKIEWLLSMGFTVTPKKATEAEDPNACW